jgi:hypothetical protein
MKGIEMSAGTLYSLKRLASGPKDSHLGIIAGLIMFRKIFLILTRTCLNTSEMIYDDHEADFTEIVELAPMPLAGTATEDKKQPPFAFDMGISLPIFVTILKCRSPTVRRQALRLQLQCPQIQSLYVGSAAAHYLAAIVVLEEMGPFPGGQVPVIDLFRQHGRVPTNEQRVADFALIPGQTDGDSRGNRLQYLQWRCIELERVSITETVTLPQDQAL